jgi:hypothetical protein
MAALERDCASKSPAELLANVESDTLSRDTIEAMAPPNAP